jgi:hypothetical protein
MVDSRDFFLKVQRQITAIIQGLKPDQIEHLAAGKAKLVFLPAGAQVVLPESEARERLAGMRNRTEAEEYLASMMVTELRTLARQLDIAVYSKDKKADLKRKIVDGTVGMREDSAAIRSWRG